MSQQVLFQPKPVTGVWRFVRSGLQLRRLAMILPALALVLGPVYWFFLRPPSSIQAFVNTDVIVLRAPVAGKVVLSPDLLIGTLLAPGQEIGQLAGEVENPLIVSLKLQAEQKRTRIAVLEEQSAGVTRRLAERNRLVEQFSRESEEELRLRQSFLAAQVNGAHEDLRRLIARTTLVSATERRARTLSARGFASQAVLDDAVSSGAMLAAEIEGQRARVKQYEAALEASGLGLELDGGRTMGQPVTRLRELRTEIVDLEQQRQELTRTQSLETAELAVIDAELHRQEKVLLRAPKEAVVWSIDARPGETVPAGATLLQLADCRQIWVEAFFDEATAPAMAVHQTVKVRLLHGRKAWNGVIETIRAGTGRVSVGDSVVLPPPEISRRQLPVRVITVRVKVDWGSDDLQPTQFCMAGRSAEVSFE